MKKSLDLKKLKLEEELESKQLDEELKQLEKEKSQLEKNIDKQKKFQNKFFTNWKKLKKIFISLMIFSIIIVLGSLSGIIFNIQITKNIGNLAIYLTINLWNNLFFLGLTILTVSLIFYQLRQSTIHQMQVNLFWKEWDKLEKLSKRIFEVQNKIIIAKANKYVVDSPTIYIGKDKFIPEDALDPKKVKDPELKALFEKINEEFKKNPKQFRTKTTKELLKKGGVFSP